MSRSFRLVLALVFLAVGWNWAGPVRADVVFYSSGGAFSSQLQALGIHDLNVLFNQPGGANGPAPTITGVTNQLGLLVDISSTENLTGKGGQAPAVQAQDGAFSNASVAFQDPNLMIQSLFFNLDNVPGVSESTVRFTVSDQKGDLFVTDIVNNGNNFFGVIASNGQFLQSGSIQVLNSSSGSTDVLERMRQIRISAVDAASGSQVHVPEPQSWLAWLAAVGGMLVLVALRRSPAQARVS